METILSAVEIRDTARAGFYGLQPWRQMLRFERGVSIAHVARRTGLAYHVVSQASRGVIVAPRALRAFLRETLEKTDEQLFTREERDRYKETVRE